MLVKNKMFLFKNGFTPYGFLPNPLSDRHWEFETGYGHIHDAYCYDCGKKTSQIAKITIEKLKSINFVDMVNNAQTENILQFLMGESVIDCRRCLHRIRQERLADLNAKTEQKIQENERQKRGRNAR